MLGADLKEINQFNRRQMPVRVDPTPHNFNWLTLTTFTTTTTTTITTSSTNLDRKCGNTEWSDPFDLLYI